MRFSWLYGLLGASLLVSGCIARRPTVVSSQYHALTAHYNALFNGNEALAQGIEKLDRKTEEDFYREFPLEGVEFNDKVILPGQSRTQEIQKAEEKATKAVQKHSIIYRGVEYNPRMDEAFLLLGQGRYYDQRYLAALDAFNYALTQFYDTDLRNRFLLWRGKTRLRMDQRSLAKRDFQQVINLESKNSDTKALAYAFLAETVRGDTLEMPVARLTAQAARTARSRRLQNRLAYKAAQLWEELGRRDSAAAMLDLVLRHKQPENYYLHALWYKMRLTKADTALQEKYLKKLQSYFKNYYYHRYYPDIDFTLADIYEFRGDTARAIRHYARSTRSAAPTLKKIAYNRLADIYWDRSDYLTAGQYLDSLLKLIPEDRLEHLLVSQRRRSIDKIIKWEQVIRRNDSLLRLARLSPDEQKQIIEAHIRRLREAREREARRQADTVAGEGTSTFYFYNPRQLAEGREAFIRRWGDRPLEDLWRLRDKYGQWTGRPVTENPPPAADSTATARQTDSLLDPAYYLRQIPRTEAQKDSLRRQTRLAHLYLGLHYSDDKLREYDLALSHLQEVLRSNPGDELRSRAWYLMHKIYKKQHRDSLAQSYALKLQKYYPASPYTQYILRPADFKGSSSRDFYEGYQQIYRLFEQGKWDVALRAADSLYLRFRNHPEAAKILLLRARIAGRLQGIDAYIAGLKAVEKQYADTEYAAYAQQIRRQLESLREKYPGEETEKFPFYVVFRITDGDTATVSHLRSCLDRIYRQLETQPRDMFIDRYSPDSLFVVIRPFLSRQSAGFIIDKLKENHCQIPGYFIISRNNYIHLQLTKSSSTKPKDHVFKQGERNHRERNHVETAQPLGPAHQNARRNPFARGFPDRRGVRRHPGDHGQTGGGRKR